MKKVAELVDQRSPATPGLAQATEAGEFAARCAYWTKSLLASDGVDSEWTNQNRYRCDLFLMPSVDRDRIIDSTSSPT